jgi:membrane-associated phospholipid phosphatase
MKNIFLISFLFSLNVYAFEEKFLSDVKSQSLAQNETLMNVGERYGSIGAASLALVPYILLSAIDADEKNIRVWRTTFNAYAVSTVSVIALKGLIGRARPYVNKGPNEFKAFSYLNSDYQAFPSGHTTVAVGVSVALAESVDSWWLRSTLYPLAGLAAYSRMAQNKHWLTDVLAGAALGYFSARWSLRREINRQEKSAHILPYWMEHHSGIQWVKAF